MCATRCVIKSRTLNPCQARRRSQAIGIGLPTLCISGDLQERYHFIRTGLGQSLLAILTFQLNSITGSFVLSKSCYPIVLSYRVIPLCYIIVLSVPFVLTRNLLLNCLESVTYLITFLSIIFPSRLVSHA